MTRLLRRAALPATLAALSLAAPAAAHPGEAHPADPVSGTATVKLRGCWLTVAYVPRPAVVLRRAFRRPPALNQTF